MAKGSVKPMIPGGRSLSKLYRGQKGSSGGKKTKRPVWFQAFIGGKIEKFDKPKPTVATAWTDSK